jgi:hypothetical protein
MTEEPYPEATMRLCPTCQAMPPKTGDMSLLMWIEDGVVVHQLHAYDCGDHLEWQLQMEIGADQVRQEQERAEQLFPDAVARFRAALQALPADQADSPFAQALVELVTLKDDKFHGSGGFVILPEWADILDRHFPAADR